MREQVAHRYYRDIYREVPDGPRTNPWARRRVEVLDRNGNWISLAEGEFDSAEGDRIRKEHRRLCGFG